ncbi:MAG: putative beta-lysine N-acetyltransferase [Desulfotomaculaceae bacterium]|nr:putative beta-lysine N-acetyltransferase [Desulfotomaculaceae bacterium]
MPTRNKNTRPDKWGIVQEKEFNCRILTSPYNKRITVYDFELEGNEGAGKMVRVLTEKALKRGLDKIWLKSKVKWVHAFTSAGMQLEAKIPGYFMGKEQALIFAKYLSVKRQTASNKNGRRQVIKLLLNSAAEPKKRMPATGITLKQGQAQHCKDLARLYDRVFITYPFPVFDPGYLKNTMEHGVYYMTAWTEEEGLVAAASAEINFKEKNAEVTDFATLPEWRGRGLASCLLKQLETRLRSGGIRCFYTIARSSSAGMNKVFAGLGYGFRGILNNNCNIGGDFEDMNVWSKNLYRGQFLM